MVREPFDPEQALDGDYNELASKPKKPFLSKKGSNHRKAVIFCYGQHAQEPGADVAEYEDAIRMPQTGAEFHRRGVFEFLTRPDERAEHETRMLQEWLDGFITEELVKQIVEKWSGGDLRLRQTVAYLRRLFERAKADDEGETRTEDQTDEGADAPA